MARKKTDDAGDLGAGQVQEAFDEAESKGYFGKKVDPTPNENYTVAGVTSGAPTPETDPDAHEAARKKFRENRFGSPKSE
jgi:hypothetical protein